MNQYVIKSNGKKELIKFDKITARIKKQCYDLDHNFVSPLEVAKKVISGTYDGITTKEIDTLTAETAAYMSSIHPDYSILGARIALSRLHKQINWSFSDGLRKLNAYIDPKTGDKAGLISDELISLLEDEEFANTIDGAIIDDRDFDYDYFGYKTLEKSYLLRMNGKISETPQYMLMRVALGIHKDDLENVLNTYELMSQRYMTHATPTLFNSGTNRPQMSSCFLVATKDDSIAGIFDTVKDVAEISKNAGGIGVHIHNIRAKDSYIKGTNGYSNGIIPMLKVFNETAKYVDQGGGKRKGSFAMYLEPWHSDIYDFLDLKKNHGKEEFRARDLFYAIWTPNLFMDRVEADTDWTLMCPNECPGLSDVYGDDFVKLYEKYEAEGKGRRTVKARDLWKKIVDSQIETGTPYILFKDSANEKSNQKNLGTIKSSNLCAEIIEYSAADESAVCNLASIALNSFVKDGVFDFEHLGKVVYQTIINLNKVIDVNYYPTVETKNSNMRHRPVGLGVQGLADTFALMNMPFDSEAARELNRQIFETMYFYSMTASKDLSIKYGPYSTFEGSPTSKGIFQFDLWGVKPSERYDWEGLKNEVMKSGIRNSLLIALMPTASTSQILGNNEAFEPFTSNLYVRRVLSGEFPVVNKHLVNDLVKLNLWNETLKDRIILNNGSIQSIPEIPDDIKQKFKTVWEISQKSIINLAADRGAYVCQSQSMNLFLADPNYAKITSMLFYAYKAGLKTGSYYLRTKAASQAKKFTIDEKTLAESIKQAEEELSCSLDNPEACLSCGA